MCYNGRTHRGPPPKFSALPHRSTPGLAIGYGRRTMHDPAGHGERTSLLMRRGKNRGFVAHIADAAEQPLCRIKLNLALWQLEERPVGAPVACRFCRTLQAKRSCDDPCTLPHGPVVR